MKVSEFLTKIIPWVVSLLFILLLVYAAVSKLLDFETFQIQLGQTTLLRPVKGWLPWAVVVTELLVASLLCFGKTRLLGLYMSLFLMILFTVYIVIILNFADYVPCSCGGVLQALGWKDHLIFNSFFFLIALVGILIQRRREYNLN